MKKAYFRVILLLSSVPFAFTQFNSDCVPIVEFLINSMGKSVPEDTDEFDSEFGIFLSEKVKYENSEFGIYTYLVDNNRKVIKAKFQAAYNAGAVALSTSFGWMKVFNETEGVTALPVGYEISGTIFSYKQNIVQINCSESFSFAEIWISKSIEDLSVISFRD
ncbi:MAG: hypothetical protein LBP19_10090 [Treponema sp.]|jgi:hypothetical protein|nr:hypothetical protein [Treponema sp.]